MDSTQFYERFHQLLVEEYPSADQLIDSMDLKRNVSPYIVQLEQSVLDRARLAVKELYQLSRTREYQTAIAADDEQVLAAAPKNQSVLMAYDFHTGEKQDALIEINTNAAMYLVTDIIHRTHGNTYNLLPPALEQLKQSFINEYSQFTGDTKPPKKLVIIDEEIEKQNRYIEFLMFKDLFEKWGWNPEILEFSALKLDPERQALVTPSGDKVDFVYNRFCDFYLSRPESKDLRQAFLNAWCCFSTNPFEYQLLADKSRMIEMGSEEFQNRVPQPQDRWHKLREFVLPTYDVESYGSQEKLWADRKSLFFKPKNEYGGKSVYRGERISKGVFQRAVDENFLVQKFAPAPAPVFRHQDLETKGWKFDLRFYVYQDQIQNVVARLYRGQVTNFATDFGGFTAVEFI